jgi:hypothetical protein
MTVARDELWVDMTQFDTRVADGVWDGDAPDPDAPRWFTDVRTLVHRARGPAEPDELVDEPVLVDRMRRATLGETLADLPRRAGVRAIGRLVAVKAAAATTASVMTVAAAAATTGIVATVAATVVVPAIHQRVMPIIGGESPPAAEAPAETGSDPDGARGDATPRSCDADEDCIPGFADRTVDGTEDEPAAPTAEPEPPAPSAAASDEPAAEQAPVTALAPEATTTTEPSPAPTTTEPPPAPTTTSAPSPKPEVELPSPASNEAPPAKEPPGPAPTTTDPAQASPAATADTSPEPAASLPAAADERGRS